MVGTASECCAAAKERKAAPPWRPQDHQEARSTLTTLNRGSRSTWMFKTKPSGQVGSARRSATVLAVTATPVSTSISHVVAVAEKKLSHFLDCIGCVSHARSRSRPMLVL